MANTVADDIKHEVLVALGNDVVPVELTSDSLSICIKRALEKYTQYKPLTDKASFQVVSGFVKTDLDASVTGIRDVTLTPALNNSILSGLQIENALISGVPIYLGADLSLDIEYLALRRMWLKTVSRQLGTDPDHHVYKDPTTNIFTIYTYCSSPMYVDVSVTKRYNEDLSNIPSWNKFWIYRWTLSEAMLILANIRGKYESIPVAGTQMRLNGNTLRAEAMNMQRELLAELQGSRADLVPSWC